MLNRSHWRVAHPVYRFLRGAGPNYPAHVAVLRCLLLLHCVLLVCWYQTLGLSSASTGMFPNGAGDLVLHFITQCNSQLTEILTEQHKQVQLGQAEYVHTHSHSHKHTYTYMHTHL